MKHARLGSGWLVWIAMGGGCGSETQTSSPRHDGGPQDGSAQEQGAEASVGPVCTPKAPQCPDAMRCVATRWDLSEDWPPPRCVSNATGNALERQPCFSAAGVLDSCATGLACSNVGSGEGFCLRTCAEAPTRCDDGEICAEVDAKSGFALCLPRCDSDEACGAPGWLVCVGQGDARYCDAARGASR